MTTPRVKAPPKLTAHDLAIQVATLNGRINTVESQRDDAQAECRRRDANLIDANKRISELGKQLEESKGTIRALEQNLSRALGYIDRINENERPLDPVMVGPPPMQNVQRGPKFLEESYDYMNGRRY